MWTKRPALSLLALARTLLGESLPYDPTSLLAPPNTTLVYVLGPSTQSGSEVELSVVDYSKSFGASSDRSTTVSKSLPFLQDGERNPYTPAMDADGNITVISGNCSQGASGTEVWRFDPKDSSQNLPRGNWIQLKAAPQESGVDMNAAGSNFLANSIAFSSVVGGTPAETSIYTFGGMCPYGNSTAETWISAAEYSNLVLTLSPQHAGISSPLYDINIVPDRGPPISQAGSSVTALSPTYSIESGSEPQTQQQNFVLLGGHTQTAFINTSDVALFSLPQQNWAYVPVQQPKAPATDLAARQNTQEVSPRSGHTAVLSETGDRIIVFGGWVGDIDTPADPQLAVLELGSGYGGSADWRWTIPAVSDQGFGSSTGIYGHGATMLPGGVMMVVGGYHISSSTSNQVKRSSNTRMLLYNATSNTWLDSYNPPADLATQFQDSSGPLTTYSEKVGLGTGIGIGTAILITVVVFYLWYSKRLKRARESRQRVLLSYSTEGSSTGQLDQPFLKGGGVGGPIGDEAALHRLWPTGGAAGQAGPRPSPMQHATGMFVDVPSPTRGLRKGTTNKHYQYHAAPRYDEKRLSRGTGDIHPIAEHENEDEQEVRAGHANRRQLSHAEWKLKELERVLNSEDPFKDPEPDPLRSNPVSPVVGSESVHRVSTAASRFSFPPGWPLSTEREVPNSIVEPERRAQDQNGRISPSKSDDRTSSTLSERSQRSTNSASSICRTMSTRTGALLAAAAAAHRQAASRETSPTEERTHTMSSGGGRHSPLYIRTRAKSLTSGSVVIGAPLSAGGDADSFMTARSTFAHLQSEGEALLGGRPAIDRDDPYQRALAAHTTTRTNTLGTLSESGPPLIIPPRRAQGWMGSLRRAINAVSGSERSVSLTTSSERYRDDLRSASSSPTKDRRLGSSPRRAVSDGGALLRQKRGQKDWDEKHWAPYKDDPDPGDWGEPRTAVDQQQAEEDWDVEEAAGKRDFQVMFTVPKARLRVVNDDMDRASLRSASDSAISRSSSVTTVRRDNSTKGQRARSDGDRSLLPSTEEERDDAEKEKAA